MQQSRPNRREENSEMTEYDKDLGGGKAAPKCGSHCSESHITCIIIPAARGTLYPSSNTAGASSSPQHTFSAVPLLGRFAERQKNRENIQFMA